MRTPLAEFRFLRYASVAPPDQRCPRYARRRTTLIRCTHRNMRAVDLVCTRLKTTLKAPSLSAGPEHAVSRDLCPSAWALRKPFAERLLSEIASWNRPTPAPPGRERPPRLPNSAQADSLHALVPVSLAKLPRRAERVEPNASPAVPCLPGPSPDSGSTSLTPSASLPPIELTDPC